MEPENVEANSGFTIDMSDPVDFNVKEQKVSLFPAYSADPASTRECTTASSISSKEEEFPSWLANSSYKTSTYTPSEITILDSSSSSVDERVNDESLHETASRSRSISPARSVSSTLSKKSSRAKKKKKARKRRLHERWKAKQDYERDVKNVYFEDKYRDKGNNTVKSLCSAVRPIYNSMSKALGFRPCNFPKKLTGERYYAKNLDLVEKQKHKSIISRKKTTTDPVPEEPSYLLSVDESQKTKTKEYNEKLLEESTNVPLWMEYIHFQDIVESFQTDRTSKDSRRAVIRKKLSIVEKAIEQNPESSDLLSLKLSLTEELLPADEFFNELETMISKDSGNDILWRKYIMVMQGSLAMCSVPRVLELYSRCFSTLRQRARTRPVDYDEKLLQMFYWCLMFLRHTGLWEQMWETIRLNLNLNLSLEKNSLVLQRTIDEKTLISMEEVILMSRLPLNQLWQRTESLRENCHWVSISRDELEIVGDSRRFVLPEDVADFVHPILSRNSSFRMAVYFLLLLKVPLLPTRDSMLQDLGLTGIVWDVESSEALLPFLHPAIGEMAGYKQRQELFNGLREGQLTSGPQYILYHPAQESYIDFLREIFHTIAEALPAIHRTAIYTWWLRFERLLVFIHKGDPLKFDNREKKLKAALKDFLKKNANRNNLHFYREYALIEREMGRFESCVNILKSAIQSQSVSPLDLSNIEEKAALLSLYRTYIETLLDSKTYKEEHRTQILTLMEGMIPGKQEDKLSQVEEYLRNNIKKFLEEQPTEEQEEEKQENEFFMPNFYCDTIVCFAYFLFVKKTDITEPMRVFEECIDHYANYPHLQERLYEAQLALLQLHCEKIEEPTRLMEPVKKMLATYPNNFFALSILAYLESELPIWKLNNRGADRQLWRAIAMCLAGRRRIHMLKKLDDHISVVAATNKLISFHQILARSPSTKNSPLLWRLYMLLLRECNLRENKGEEVYHGCVEQCPWARSIYIDTAEVAPQLLTQIQDVIREKELRMHVTPEELDILRG